MTLFSLLEDEVGPGVVNTHKSCVIHRGHNTFSNQTGLSNFVMCLRMKNAFTVNGEKTTNDSHDWPSLTSFSNDENYVVFLFSVFRGR